jgi:hypothetical protein
MRENVAMIDQNSNAASKPVPHALVLTLCMLFAVLWGVWVLPNTVFIRHFCLIAGACFGLYVIWPRRALLLIREAIPIWLIVFLLVWVTLHLFFIGQDYVRQLEEFTKIWKKIAISVPFALGLGLALGSQLSNPKNTQKYWAIIYLGFLLPMAIYFVKWIAALYLPRYGYTIPQFLILSPDHLNNPWAIPRAFYVFFCLPALAIALGQMIYSIQARQFKLRSSIVYLLAIPLTLLIFHIEVDRLGIAYGLISIVAAIFFGFMPMLRRRQMSWRVGAILLILLLVSGYIATKAIQSNSQWKPLIGDAKIAIQVDRFDHWKNRKKGYPVNELGATVSASNYERISWALAGPRLLIDEPLGYGLMSLSFSALGKKKWPDSDLSWTHSAWLDFALGYGFPGLLLLAGAAALAYRNSRCLTYPWRALGCWAIPSASLVMVAKEVSSETIMNALIFLIVLIVAITMVKPVAAHQSKLDL